MRFESAPPADMQALIAALRLKPETLEKQARNPI
jgi:hypothetical protein